MKSYQTRTTTRTTKNTTTSRYQPKPVLQSYNSSERFRHINRSGNTKSNLPRTFITTQKYSPNTQYHYKPRNNIPSTISSSSSNYRSSYQPLNYSTNYETSKWKNNRGGRVGDTETKVEVKQDGDYILKITTTRKVIDKGAYGYN